MGPSAFIAKLLGPYCIIIAIGIIFNQKAYQKIMEDFFKNAALIYLGGAIALILGLLVMHVHNVWVANWTVIITLFGWLGLLKGIGLIIFPDRAKKLAQAYQKNTTLLNINLVLIFAIGTILIFFGYFEG